ncbi:hypothetical protein FB451DRAFT_1378187 [Mycena latifolia]|nr:hypothetical protein FB451DRAFT_1378187 [Mycena latifolia]
MSQLALVYESQGRQSIQSRPLPEPVKGHVQVRVQAAAFNPLDYKIYDYGLDFIEKYPTVLGVDAAGEVTKIGPDVTKFKVGDRVTFICNPNFPEGVTGSERGAFQQYALADVRLTAKIPANVDYDSASSFPVAGNTAAGALYGQLKFTDPWLGGEGAYKGEKIVILGGSSSVGSYAIQLAVLSGLEAITTASPAHFDYLKSIGASAVIDRSATDVADQILAAAGGPLLGVEILQSQGKLVLVLPTEPSTKAAADAKDITMLGTYGAAGWYLSERFWDAIEGYFERGVVKFNRATVLPGGLRAWEEGLDLHRQGKSATPMSHLSTIWRPITDPSWIAFREQWWGKWPELEQLIKSKVILLGDSKVAKEFSSGSYIWGAALDTLYVREDLSGMYKRIETLFDNKRASGVIIAGQPGCGKTISLLFFLICQLAIGRPILYTKALKTTYFFNGTGIWRARLSELDSDDIPSSGGPIWSLIDSDRVSREPPDEIIRFCFPVHAVSPNETHYKGWRKHIQPHKLFMNPWSIEDLMGWMQIEPQLRDSTINHTQLRALVDLCGPVPRDIVAELRGFSTAQQVSAELGKLTMSEFWKQLGHFTTSPSQNLHKLIIVRGHINPLHEDTFTTDFKSLHVANQFYERWRVLKEEEALLFYHLCRGNAESSYLAGWAFESIAIRYASGELDHRTVFLPLRVMYASSSPTCTDSSTIPVSTLTDYNVLKVTEKGAVLQRADGTLIFRLTPAVIDALVKRCRNIIHYTDISGIPISAGLLYVPHTRNNPLFDAFFLEFDYIPKKIVVWMLQMTPESSKRHEGSARGYNLVRALKALLEGTHPGFTISISYVLIVPLLQCAVSWRLPEGWTDDIAGQVYIQYMDMVKAAST